MGTKLFTEQKNAKKQSSQVSENKATNLGNHKNPQDMFNVLMWIKYMFKKCEKKSWK